MTIPFMLMRKNMDILKDSGNVVLVPCRNRKFIPDRYMRWKNGTIYDAQDGVCL